MRRLVEILCVFCVVLSFSLTGCDKKEDGDGEKEAEAEEAPSCEEVLDHIASLGDGPAPDGDARARALEGCEKESTAEQRTCMVKAESMEEMAKCSKGEDSAPAAAEAPSGPSGNSWKKADFNPSALKQGRLQTNTCNALIAGIDACRKRSDARLGQMNNDLVLSRRTVYVNVKEMEKNDVMKATEACADYQTELQKSDDCEASVAELAGQLE